VWGALKGVFARHAGEEAHSAVNGHAPAESAVPPPVAARPPLEPQPEPVSPETIINRFEPLLVHAPRNIKVLETLAEAYARKMMFDQSLSLYRRALDVVGGKNPDIEKAIARTTLKKLDWMLSQIDPNAPDQAAQRERIQNQRLEFQWHEMEEPH